MKGGVKKCLEGVEDAGVESVAAVVTIIVEELVGECEGDWSMLCKKPFTRHSSVGVDKKHILLSDDARQALTPFPCGQCLPCRINRARIWTHRILLESLLHERTGFITLTYDDEHLPLFKSLRPDDVTRFIKKIRKAIAPRKLRYFVVGEYGTRSHRPHYHMIAFGLSILDENLINEKWEYGFTKTGDVNKDSARYCTGYVVKNLTRPAIVKNSHNKEIFGKHPEYMRCSKMEGGLGFGVIKRIADKIKDNPKFKEKVVRELRYGKQVMPLGKYLTQKLQDEVDTSEGTILMDLYKWQDEMFEKHLKKGEIFLTNLVDEYEGKRIALEKRQKIKRKTTM